MFDNPKKELDRLQAQLLAAEERGKKHVDESTDEEFDLLYNEIYEEFGREEPYEMDSELAAMLRPRREDDDEVLLDEERYVPGVKEKSLKGLVIFGLAQALIVIVLALWWIGRLS